MRLRGGAFRAVVLLAASLALRDAAAASRLVRVYDWASGFPWSYAAGLEQDRRGFLWISATSGLFRFDGTRAVRFGSSMGVAPGGTAAGRVIVYSSEGTFEGTPEGLRRLDRVQTNCPASIVLAVATDGTPWRVCDGRLERLEPGGAWTPIALTPAPDRLTVVRPGRNGRVFAASLSRLWSVEADGTSRLLANVDRIIVMLERADGTILAGTNQNPGPVTTRLFEIAGGSARAVYERRGARLLSLAERGDTLWVAMDQGLEGLGPGYASRDPSSPPPAVASCGHIVIDHEGSLWMGTARGLIQLPEPDVYAVAPEGHGVTRDLTRTERGIWGSFWGRLGFLGDAAGRSRWVDAGEHYSITCRDGAGRVWTAGPHGVTALTPDGAIGRGFGGSWNPERCGAGADGRRWIVSAGSTLWVADPRDPSPHAVRVDVTGSDGLTYAAEGDDGTLWVATGSRMCAAPAAEVAAGREVAWRCETLPGRDVIGLETMPSGDVWGLMWSPNAIVRRAGGRWEVVPGGKTLGVNWINAIRPSPAGGIWLVGQGLVARVAERLDLPDGLEILEQPTAWNGLMSLNVSAIHEDPDGTLWLGTDVGIERIPAAIRKRRADPPPVELVSGSVNGAPLDLTRTAELPYGKSRLEMHFAALTFRDPSAVRYRMRLRDDDPWSDPSRDGRFDFVDLPPGRYSLSVAASLDGARWSGTPAHLAFRIGRPWYANPWLLGGGAVGLGLAGHLSQRLRAKRRLDRERQRTRIAMDLHDEVGSGLGTISVLAGIAARPDLPEERRGEVTARIAGVSQELARSLGDIVWSLRTTSGTLDALWNQLLDRARPLFAADRPRAVFEAPDPVPGEALSLVVRRNLHLVAYEALHNAARHAGATTVTLRLLKDGDHWRLEIEDDGKGLEVSPAPTTRRGLGIEAMRARIAEMGGTISWDRAPSGGTRVTVRFRTGGDRA